jgi:mercuric ion binding protein
MLALALLVGTLLAAVVPTRTAVAQSLQSVTLDVQNMTCAACPITVRKALTKVSGVVEAKVDLDSKTAVVTFDPAKTGVEALTKATANAGFPSSLKR